jgi:hypothetical protein
MKQELKLLKEIIRDYTPDEYPYEPVEGSRKAKKSDYDHVDVIPVSDPNAATMAQKIVQYQAVLQLAQGAPQIYNLPQLHRQMLDVLGIRNAQKLIPLQEDQKPRDPITENMNVMVNKPLKAFIYQDQEAHLAVHTAFLQDPQAMAIIGQNPMGQQIVAAMQAHIAEHFGFKYRQQIEQQMGGPIPYLKDDEEVMPEEYEVQLSRLVAQAATQLTQQNQAAAAQQQAQQQAQDPIIQMQMKELQLQEQEIVRKTQKDQADIALRQEQLEIDRQRVEGQLEIDGTRLGVQIEKDKDIADRKEEYDGTKLGIEMMRSKEQNHNQRLQTAAQLLTAAQNRNSNNKKGN